jgi:hypothetical protein
MNADTVEQICAPGPLGSRASLTGTTGWPGVHRPGPIPAPHWAPLWSWLHLKSGLTGISREPHPVSVTGKLSPGHPGCVCLGGGGPGGGDLQYPPGDSLISVGCFPELVRSDPP